MGTLLEGLFKAAHPRASSMLAALPGPSPVPVFGNALSLAGKDLHTFFEGWRETYGDYLVFWLWGQPSLLTARPELVAEVLIHRADDWMKNVPIGATKPSVGDSVFRSEGGEDWSKKRRDHPFELSWVGEFYDGILGEMGPVLDAHLEKVGPRVDLYDVILRATFEVFARAVFGEPLPPEAFDEHEALLREIGRRGALPVPFSWDPSFWWKRARWLRRLEARMARGSLGESAPDLISRLARLAGPRFHTQQMRDEVSTIFPAGMKNAAIAAAAVAFLLARHDGWRARVRAELSSVDTTVRKSLASLAVLDRVVKESMRLYPVVPGFARQVRPGREVSLGGVVLPPETQIFLVSWIVHRHPLIWSDPLRFDPDRFLREPREGTYFPFGAGARSCVGEDWTILVAKGLVSELYRRHDVSVDPSCTFETSMSNGTTPPRGGVPATITRRG